MNGEADGGYWVVVHGMHDLATKFWKVFGRCFSGNYFI